MKSMKLGLYCNWGIKKHDGEFYIQSSNKNYIDVFQKNSQEIYLLSKTRESFPDSDYVKIKGIEIIELPYFSNYASSVKYFFHILIGIQKLVKKCDFIYIRVPEPFGWAAAILRYVYKTKLHYHYVSFPLEVIDSYKSPKILKLIKKLIYMPEYYLSVFASSLNTVSCLGKNGKNKLPSIIKNKAIPLYEASYTKDFKSTKKESTLDDVEKVRFLYVGRLVAGKGLEELIESVKLLNAETKCPFSFTIAGDGILKLKLENIVIQHNLQDRVTFIGAIKFGKDLDNVYTSHDVLISPSFSETGPRTILEAASNFLYIISTDVGYVREIFCSQAEHSCRLVEAGNIIDLVQALNYVLENKSQCKTMADKAEKISKSYTLDNFIEIIIEKATK